MCIANIQNFEIWTPFSPFSIRKKTHVLYKFIYITIRYEHIQFGRKIFKKVQILGIGICRYTTKKKRIKIAIGCKIKFCLPSKYVQFLNLDSD